MNTYDKYIWFQKQCKVSYVIQYGCNVSHNLSHIYINTNFTLLGSSSSTSITKMDTTSDMTVKCTSLSTSMDTTCDMTAQSSKTGDTTSGI